MLKRKHRHPMPVRRKQKRETPAQARLDATADHIRQRYLGDQVGIVRLSEELGVSVQALAKWLDRNGVPRRGREEAGAVRHQAFLESMGETYAEAVRLRTEEGLTIQAISHGMAVSQKTVRNALCEAGLTPPPQSPEKMPSKS